MAQSESEFSVLTNSFVEAGVRQRIQADLKTIVTIQCGQMVCALEHTAVREIAPVPHLSHPPGLPALVEGMINLGGQMLAVVDLARLLDTPPNPDVDPLYRHIIALEDGDVRFALLVDRVEDLLQVSDEAIAPVAPEASLNGCVLGEVTLGGSVIPLLHHRNLLLAAEKAALLDLQRAEQQRLDALGKA